jgi:hypothetical protein
VHLAHLFTQTITSLFEKRENKRSASADVGKGDKDIYIFDFLYSLLLVFQFKKDSLNCRNFQTLLKPEVLE